MTGSSNPSIKKKIVYICNRMYDLLITGSNGLLGHAVETLARDEKWLKENRVSQVISIKSKKVLDLRKKEDVQYLFDKFHPTHVIHLAARVGGLFDNMENNKHFFNDNVE